MFDFAGGKPGVGITVDVQPCPELADLLRHVAQETQRAHPHCVVILRVSDLRGVRCDRERVTQVFSNLLTNALDHGDPHCPVEVSADIHDNVFMFGVHNQGPPIAPEIMARLFQPVSHPTQRGLGLGLYLANQIVLAHGGRLEVLSSAEAGTLVSFRLPLT